MIRTALALGALLLIGAGEPGPEHTALRAAVGRIEDDLDAWNVQAARADMAKLRAVFKDRDAAPVQLMEAKVLFYEGAYAKSAQLYAQAGAEDRDGSYRKLAEDALAQTRDDQVAHGDHFDLFYPPGKDAVLAPYALETLEKSYAALSLDLAFTPPGRIRVEILPDDEALARLSTLTVDQIRTTGTIAICKFNRLMIISPRALLHGYDWRDTLNHELTHFFVSMKSKNTVPIWLHEGIAKYEETRWRGPGGLASTPASEALLGMALKKDKLITFEQMYPSMALLPSQEDAATAFAEVFHAVEFLLEKGGYPLLDRVIDGLEAGDTDQAAVANAYGAPFARFFADWKAYLRERTYPDAIPLGNEKLAFKGKGAKDAVEATQLSDFADIKDPEARKLAHLGELLRVRHRTKAAIVELDKAHARVGDKSPELANRFARVLLDDGQLQRAAELLDASSRLHPGDELTEVHLGEALLGLKQPEEARDHFLRGIDVDPFDPRLHQGLLRAYAELKQPDLAERARLALAALGAAPGPPASGQAVGTVVLATHPFAKVAVDGRELGRTTPTEIELPPGKHHLRLVNGERGLVKELDVQVREGERQELRLDLSAANPSE